MERIAVGGMAEIFKAKQVGVRGFEKIVVIKKILHHLSEDPEFVEMFEDEARIAAQLTQANIVQIYELGEIEHTLYITMEFVDGKNLRDITRTISQRHLHLGIDQCIFIIAEILKGLDYAHRKTDSKGSPLEIVHRDMSPQNIIVSYEGEAKILDFGIAKAASRLSRTEAGVLKGKFSYMSPEQASGKIIDQRSDIYACGVIAHELLTSDRLFRSKTDMETLERVKEGKVDAPSLKNPQIPKELDEIILKSLAKNPKERYQTAGEFLNDLSKFAIQAGFNYNSQDLGAFMKTLFAGNIQEEAQRLNDLLSRVPKSANDQILNAQTRVAFKQTPSSQNKDQDTFQNKKDATFTVSKKVQSSVIPKLFNKKILSAVLLIAGLSLLLLTRKTDESKQEKIESLITEEKVANIPSASPVETLDPVPLKGKGERMDHIFGELKPSAQPEVKLDATPLPSPIQIKTPVAKPKPTPPQKKNLSGRLNVIPPPEGFAELYIDESSFGTVPGPKARGIILTEGAHEITCKTKSKNYSGKIEVRPDEEISVKCGDLK